MNTNWFTRSTDAEGEQPMVVALHSGAGSAQEWEPLAERLRPGYRVVAPELCGYAESRGLAVRQPPSLDAEAALIGPVLDISTGPVYLVGHDYGAAVALKLARQRRDRIAGLVLYEPSAFGLLQADPRSSHALMHIAVLRRVLRRYLDAGDWFRAARYYVDHRLSADAWEGLEVTERSAIHRRMPDVYARIDAALADRTPASRYVAIDVPVLLLRGTRTRTSFECVAQILARTLPRAERRTVADASHRGIDSHPEQVDREIEASLAQYQATWHRDPDPTAAFGLPAFAYRQRNVEHAAPISP